MRRTRGRTALPVASMAIGTLAERGAPAADRFANADGDTPRSEIPTWLYPRNPPAAAVAAADDSARPVRVPGGTVTLGDAELSDLYFAPDCCPRSHAPVPEIVARGRAPDVYACGYRHSPSGQGRSENASLAGLPPATSCGRSRTFAAVHAATLGMTRVVPPT